MRRQPYPWEVLTADECQARWGDLVNREPITEPRAPTSKMDEADPHAVRVAKPSLHD